MTENLQEAVIALTELAASKAADPRGGITRLLYSREWVETQKEIKGIMEREGMETRFDEIGNLYGRISGSTCMEETILTGSHVDTVRNGGKYDGMYGIAAGILAIGHLNRTYGPPKKNMEVVAFAEEEGSRFPTVFWGSKNFLGLEKRCEVAELKDDDGITFEDAMGEAGFDFKKEEGAYREDVKAFLEAHIEQGGVLEAEEKEIGIVDSIAGQRRYHIHLTGTANHAGTTPMSYRRDALYAAAKMIGGILDKAGDYGPPLVATVGHVEVKPDMANVVPGEAEFSLDVRHTEEGILDKFIQEITFFMEETARACGVGFRIHMWMKELPVPMDPELVECLSSVCRQIGASSKIMHSGAGHDSQLIAREIPTVMIFVPSRGGISHNPEEYTTPEHLVRGIETLAEAIHQLAY